jgi:pimeloyl-ACP methyl ester carboxylesterase
MQQFRNGDLVFDVTDVGPPDGEVVVLLHGFPEFKDSWDRVVPQLTAAGYRCLAPDQRGYSAGARPPRRRDYRIPLLVSDVLALIDASGAQRVHLVGHDWGAAVSWAVAAEHADRLASLSALSVPHGAAFVRSMATSRQGLSSWYMYAFQLPRAPERVLLGKHGRDSARLMRFLRRFGQSPRLAEHTARELIDTGALPYALNWYRAMLLLDPRQVGTKVRVPTLFVWSDGDVAVRRNTAEACAKWVEGPYRFEVLEGVSHWMLDEAPDSVGELLLKQFGAYPSS